MAQNEEIEACGMTSQSSDLNSTEILWVDLTQAVHARNPSNIAQFKYPNQCQKLVDSYKKHLYKVVSAKGAVPVTEAEGVLTLSTDHLS